ncbi:plasmid replication [Pseudomonas sp. Os17]|nr:plasmid replication [Pseudomonas sp. Os17]
MAAAEDQARQDMAKARQQVAEAVAGRQAAELRLADLELLLSQRQTQIDDLQQQRESAAHERREAQQHPQELQQEPQALRLKAEQEHVAQENYVRGIEDRAHREIDRSREEVKAVANQLKAASRKSDDLQRKLELSQSELSQAQQRATAQLARAETLEQQLIRMRELPKVTRKPRVRKVQQHIIAKSEELSRHRMTAIGQKQSVDYAMANWWLFSAFVAIFRSELGPPHQRPLRPIGALMCRTPIYITTRNVECHKKYISMSPDLQGTICCTQDRITSPTPRLLQMMMRRKPL